MRGIGRVFFTVFLTSSLLLSACGGDSTEKAEEAVQDDVMEETAAVEFYCPMKCEGEQTYSEPIPCPVCGMEMVESTTDKVEGEYQGDYDHEHDHDHDHDHGDEDDH